MLGSLGVPSLRHVAASALLLLLAACGGRDHLPMPDLPPAPATQPTVPIDSVTLAHPEFHALLAAGDASRRVYNDAALQMRDMLGDVGLGTDRVRVMSADPKTLNADLYERDINEPVGRRRGGPVPIGVLPGAIEPSTLALLSNRIIDLKATAPGMACLVYLSSTPRGDGLRLADDRVLTPDILDRALIGGCGTSPTVVVISACNAGTFARSPMTRPNRLILTASSAGASGFGCGPNVDFTTFDECFLGALDSATDWTTVFDRTRACVAQRERLVGQPTVAPQSFVGAAAAQLATPWRDAAVSHSVNQVSFLQGVGRLTADALPYFPTLRARNDQAINDYLRAPAPKALALTFAGTVAWAAATQGETPDDVARIAVQRCEYASGGSCVLFARNLSLTALSSSGMPPEHPPLLVRTGRLTPQTAPFIRDAQRAEISRYLGLPGSKALALSPSGETIGTGTGATVGAAREAALAHCRRGGATDCVLYAEGDRVVPPTQP